MDTKMLTDSVGQCEYIGDDFPFVNIQKAMEAHHVQWVIRLFRLGHVQVPKLLVITSG